MPSTTDILVLATALMSAVAAFPAVAAQAADLDCSTRTPEYDDPKWRCVKASSFAGQCVPASAFEQWACLELDADATFCDDGQAFHTTVYLTTNGKTLDCNGQTIEHAEAERQSGRPGVRAPYARSVHDIAIRNCNIRNTGSYGIDLRRFFRGAELDKPLVGHEAISIENVNIAHTQRIGIYMGQNSREIAVDHVTIDDSHMGIYLGNTTTESRISYTTITNSHTREGIAVDSSQHNLIEHVVLHGNKGGGIKVYKNCGEVDGQACPIKRELSASYNTFRYNELYGEDIDVASRQFKLYGPDHCVGIDIVGFWRDHAEHNVLYGNYLENGKIDIQDSNNVVYGNVLESSTIELGKVAPLGASPIDIDGVVAENELSADSSIEFAALERRFEGLELFNNRYHDGACWPDNSCGEHTVLFGERVLNAGLVAVLF